MIVSSVSLARTVPNLLTNISFNAFVKVTTRKFRTFSFLLVLQTLYTISINYGIIANRASIPSLFKCIHASLHEGPFVRRSVVMRFFQ